jgi:hypothetical protein
MAAKGDGVPFLQSSALHPGSLRKLQSSTIPSCMTRELFLGAYVYSTTSPLLIRLLLIRLLGLLRDAMETANTPYSSRTQHHHPPLPQCIHAPQQTKLPRRLGLSPQHQIVMISFSRVCILPVVIKYYLPFLQFVRPHERTCMVQRDQQVPPKHGIKTPSIIVASICSAKPEILLSSLDSCANFYDRNTTGSSIKVTKAIRSEDDGCHSNSQQTWLPLTSPMRREERIFFWRHDKGYCFISL